jgi:hypothetical protein
MTILEPTDKWFAVQSSVYNLDMYVWCQQMCGPCGDKWEQCLGKFMFSKEADRTLFILRWS